jgi:hypothetical protein
MSPRCENVSYLIRYDTFSIMCAMLLYRGYYDLVSWLLCGIRVGRQLNVALLPLNNHIH